MCPEKNRIFGLRVFGITYLPLVLDVREVREWGWGSDEKKVVETQSFYKHANPKIELNPMTLSIMLICDNFLYSTSHCLTYCVFYFIDVLCQNEHSTKAGFLFFVCFL